MTDAEIRKARATKLSTNFSLFELISSTSRPDLMRWPSDAVLQALREFTKNVLQPIRDRFGRVRINSGWRNAQLNAAVGGVRNSIHKIFHKMKFIGVATDIVTLDEPDFLKVMAFIDQKIPAAKRAILYRNTRDLGIRNPFLHVDSAQWVQEASRPILLEKTGRSTYVNLDRREIENYKF